MLKKRMVIKEQITLEVSEVNLYLFTSGIFVAFDHGDFNHTFIISEESITASSSKQILQGVKGSVVVWPVAEASVEGAIWVLGDD